jgi:hypothetical protein
MSRAVRRPSDRARISSCPSPSLTPGWIAPVAATIRSRPFLAGRVASTRIRRVVSVSKLSGSAPGWSGSTKSDGAQNLFFYLALDRSKANLALARHQLRRIEGDLSV